MPETKPAPDKGKSILEKIKESLDNLVTLKIVTAVGSVVLKTDKDGSPLDSQISADAKAMVTEIDLLQGDITTAYDEEFVTGQYKELRSFHQQREAQGMQIIKDNINALKELIGLASNKDLK